MKKIPRIDYGFEEFQLVTLDRTSSSSRSIDKIEVYDVDHRFVSYGKAKPVWQFEFRNHFFDLESWGAAKLDDWCLFVDGIKFDFNKDIAKDLPSEHCKFAKEVDLINEMCITVREYISESEGFKEKIEFSIDSARNYLYLIPALSRYSYNFNIDADTGFVNLGFSSRGNEMLTALVSNRGEIHYSLVARGRKLVKISGTAKIRDKRDFINFKKVLRML